ncbi:MAG: hypothetical protein OEZ47_03945 [Gammaproteobacteria bacterium]|nr:hypothetical protein [Gammaproteobacteria bacterium]
MARQRSDYFYQARRSFVVSPPHHFSMILTSNSGNAALANLPYEIIIDDNTVLRGATDDDGFFEHENVPPGEYELLLNNRRYSGVIFSIPQDIERMRYRVKGFYFSNDDERNDDEINEELEFPDGEERQEHGSPIQNEFRSSEDNPFEQFLAETNLETDDVSII